MNMKKVMSVLLAVAMTVGMGVSASAEGEDTYANGLSKTEEVVLKMAIPDQGNGTAQFDATLKLFQSLYPNVKVDATISADIGTIVDTKINAGNDEDMFDLFYTLSRQSELVSAGVIEPCDDVWDYEYNDTPGKTLRELAPEGLVDGTHWAGWPDGERHVAVFPTMGGSYWGFYFNKTLFEEKGWNQNPQTWQEFLELCEAIKNEGMTPLVSTGVHSYYLTGALVNAKAFELAHEGSDIESFTDSFQNYGEDYYNNEYMIGTWKKIAELGEKGYWHNGMAGMNHTQAQMQVLQGNTAMVATGSWVGNEMSDSTPEGFEWGYMTLPFRETQDTPLYVGANLTNSGLMIWANKPDTNKAWCKEFIRLMCDMSVQEALAESGSIPVIRTDFSESAERMALLDNAAAATLSYISENECLSAAETYFKIPSGVQLAQAQQNFTDNYVGMMLAEADPETVLEESQNLLNEAWEE